MKQQFSDPGQGNRAIFSQRGEKNIRPKITPVYCLESFQTAAQEGKTWVELSNALSEGDKELESREAKKLRVLRQEDSYTQGELQRLCKWPPGFR